MTRGNLVAETTGLLNSTLGPVLETPCNTSDHHSYLGIPNLCILVLLLPIWPTSWPKSFYLRGLLHVLKMAKIYYNMPNPSYSVPKVEAPKDHTHAKLVLLCHIDQPIQVKD